MRVRVSQATLKRVATLYAPLEARQNRAAFVIALQGGIVSGGTQRQFTLAQRTILSWPRIEPLEMWEARACEQQAALIAASAEDRGLLTGRDPSVINTLEEARAEEQRHADHHTWNRADHAQRSEGGLLLVRASEDLVRTLTRPTGG